MTGPETIFGMKVATLVSSGVAAVLSVALEWKGHDWKTAIGSVGAGMFVAVIATELTLELLGVSENPGSWGYAVAAAFGITGRNLILWLKSKSRNPTELLRDVFGVKKTSDDGE